jgi:hypothetical protein
LLASTAACISCAGGGAAAAASSCQGFEVAIGAQGLSDWLIICCPAKSGGILLLTKTAGEYTVCDCILAGLCLAIAFLLQAFIKSLQGCC